ncbi:MAG TPA: DUF4394 domain-containing protein [Candidatus Binatia bacterium]|nr:DUF4394 domain-containing protein [Candidatus Binatia bacterium]
MAGLLALGLTTTATAGRPDCTRGNRVYQNGNVKRLTIVGLTADSRLVCFGDQTADRAVEIGPITGLGGADATIVGIDFRVQDGKLYGVGSGGGVYALDVATGAATLAGTLSVTLDGTAFGVDFNPAADRLRIVSNTGQNLRHDVNTGGTTLQDGALNYTAGVTTSGIAGAAYTNNDLDPTTVTSLFDLDTALDQIAVQAPPNNGSLGATGKLGVDAGSAVGLDVFSAVVDGVTVGNHAFAVLDDGNGPAFYTIAVLTGTATLVDAFVDPVVDIAIPLAR